MAVMQEWGRDVAKELIQRQGQLGVPVIIIDGEVVVGFQRSLLDSLLP